METENLIEKLKQSQKNLLIQEEGFSFASTFGQSSKQLFGESWLHRVCNYVSVSDAIKNGEGTKGKKLKSLEDMKPDDLILLGLNMTEQHAFREGNYINIDGNIYKGEYHKVVAVKDNNSIVINIPYNGENSGRILNPVTIKKLNKSISKYIERINTPEEKQEAVEQLKEIVEKIQEAQQTQQPTGVIRKLEHKSNWFKIAATIAIILGVGSIIIYVSASEGKKQITNIA